MLRVARAHETSPFSLPDGSAETRDRFQSLRIAHEPKPARWFSSSFFGTALTQLNDQEQLDNRTT
jgi:hypothetical protein